MKRLSARLLSALLALGLLSGCQSAGETPSSAQPRADDEVVIAMGPTSEPAAGFDPAYGARPLRRTIRAQVEDPLAELLLSGALGPGGTAVVLADGDRIKIISAPREQIPAASVQGGCDSKTKGESTP